MYNILSKASIEKVNVQKFIDDIVTGPPQTWILTQRFSLRHTINMALISHATEILCDFDLFLLIKK
jgi:hypothetical protein